MNTISKCVCISFISILGIQSSTAQASWCSIFDVQLWGREKSQLAKDIEALPQAITEIATEVRENWGEKPISEGNRELLISLIGQGTERTPFSRSAAAKEYSSEISDKVRSGKPISSEDADFLRCLIPEMGLADSKWATMWNSGNWKTTNPLLQESKDGIVSDVSTVAPGELLHIKMKDGNVLKNFHPFDITAEDMMIRRDVTRETSEKTIRVADIESIYSLNRHAKAFIGRQVKLTRYDGYSMQGEVIFLNEGVLRLTRGKGWGQTTMVLTDIRSMECLDPDSGVTPMKL